MSLLDPRVQLLFFLKKTTTTTTEAYISHVSMVSRVLYIQACDIMRRTAAVPLNNWRAL